MLSVIDPAATKLTLAAVVIVESRISPSLLTRTRTLPPAVTIVEAEAMTTPFRIGEASLV